MKHPDFVVYTGRWAVLAVFSSLGCLQCIVWGTYGPISTCVDRIYGWDKSTVTTFSIFGPAVFIPCSFFISWAACTRGLRCTMLIGAAMLLVGTAARLLSLHEPMAFPLVVVCQLLASATGPVVLVLPPKLSSTWFPQEERTTATAIASLANSLGGAVLFILGPGMIHGCDSLPRAASPADPAIVSARSQLRHLYFVQFGWALATVLAAMAYFPDAPPTPPSGTAPTTASRAGITNSITISTASCAVARVGGGITGRSTGMDEDTARDALLPPVASDDAVHHNVDGATVGSKALPTGPVGLLVGVGGVEGFIAGFRAAMMRPAYVALVIAFGTSAGVFSCWSNLLSLVLGPLGYGESDCAWLGFSSTIASVVGGVVVARVADRLQRQHVLLVIAAFVGASIAFVWFALAVQRSIGTSLTALYVACSLGGMFLAAAQPLAYELAIEVTYPVPEETSANLLVNVYNVGSLVAILATKSVSGAPTWMNWVLAASCAGCGLLICASRRGLSDYRRVSASQ